MAISTPCVTRVLASAAFFALVGCNKSDDARQPAPAPTTSAPNSGTESAAQAEPDGLLHAGDAAPEFTTTSHSGEKVSTDSLKGKVVVLYFYPKDNTPGCTTEAQGFRDAYQSYEDLNVVVIGVSTQDNESHREFAEEHGLPFLLLPDEDGSIAKSFGVGSFLGMAKRVTFIIDQQGKIAKVYEKVAPKDHAEEVLADIRALLGKGK